MTAVVTHRSLTGRHLTGSSGSTTGCCAAQSNDSFLGSRLSCQKRREAQPATGLPITKHVGRGGYMRIADQRPAADMFLVYLLVVVGRSTGGDGKGT